MNLQPNFETILALCDDRASESHSLEFKSKQPGKIEQDKAEFAKDVVALANRGGGTIVFGISESEGAAESIVPITEEDPDSLTRRLGQTLDAMIEPRLERLEQHVIAAPDGGFILMIEIGGSIAGPHRINLGNKCRFVLREASYVRDMTYDEIRQSFLKENEVAERMRAFRSERCAAIVAENEGSNNAPAKCLIHTIPLAVVRGNQSFDMQAAESHWARFVNHQWGGGSRAFNLDGFRVYRRSESPSNFAGYCQLYRSGITETCLRASSSSEEYAHIVPAVGLFEGIESALESARSEYIEQQIAGPILLFVSLLSVKGRELGVGDRWGFEQMTADRDILAIPEVLIRDKNDPVEISKALRFINDIIWQSFGHAACTFYDSSGNWRPPR